VARACIERRLREIAAEAARRRPELSIIFDPASAQGRRVVDELLARTNFVRYGLRDMNNVLKERLGGELARLLDSRDVEGEWRLEWDAEVGVVRILPGR
jgi:hypothetical protein